MIGPLLRIALLAAGTAWVVPVLGAGGPAGSPGPVAAQVLLLALALALFLPAPGTGTVVFPRSRRTRRPGGPREARLRARPWLAFANAAAGASLLLLGLLFLGAYPGTGLAAAPAATFLGFVLVRSRRRRTTGRDFKTARDCAAAAFAALAFLPGPATLAGALAATLLLAAVLPRLHADRSGAGTPGRAAPLLLVPAVAVAATLLFLLPAPSAGPRSEVAAETEAAGRGSGDGRDGDRPGEGHPGARGTVVAPRRVSIGEIGRLQRDFRPLLEITVLRGGRPADAEIFGARFRSGALETFDGTTWASDDTRGALLAAGPDGFRAAPRRRLPAGEDVEQRIRFLAGGTDSLFCLGLPTAVGGDGARRGVLLLPRGEVRAAETYEDGASFTIRSRAAAGEHAPVDLEALPAARRAALLEVPAGHGRTVALAASALPAGAEGPDLLAAVEALLAGRCSYSLDIPDHGAAAPVEAFLFEGRRGHCELFASAAAVLLRARGVPARCVIGFRGGTFDAAAARYTLRGADAHAWVEAWFPGRGWLASDPTPGEEGDGGADAEEEEAAAPGFLDSLLSFDGDARRRLLLGAGRILGRAAGAVAALPAAAWLVLAILLGGGALLPRLRRAAAAPAAAAAAATPPPAPEAWTLVAERLAAAGIRRAPPETLREFAARAAARGVVPAADLALLAEAAAEERFGGRVPDGEGRARLRALAGGIRVPAPGPAPAAG